MNDVVDDHEPCNGDLDPDALVVRIRTAVATVADLARRHEDGVRIVRVIETLDDASDSLVAAERYLRHRLRAQDAVPGDTSLLVLLVRVQSLRLSVGEARVRRRAAAAAELHRSLTRLRAGLSASDLIREVPRELGRLGFSRSLVSDLRGPIWTARSAFAHQDESLAGALVEVGSALPGRIGREEPETEAVRRRSAVLVRDAQTKPRLHRELIRLADTRDYAAAPVVVHGTVIGLVHVDRHSQSDVVDADDRDLLGLFADGVGLAFERARYQEQFSALRRRFEQQIDMIDDAMFGTVDWDPDRDPDADRRGSDPHLPSGPLAELTRRELEVLRHLAGGASNQDIADRLGVSTGTVKTHVKGVLRKLGASNRADAAARFHALTRHPTPR